MSFMVTHIGRRASSSFKHNASFVARLPTIRRHKPASSTQSPGGDSLSVKTAVATNRVSRYTRNLREMNQSVENLGEYSNPSLEFFRTQRTCMLFFDLAYFLLLFYAYILPKVKRNNKLQMTLEAPYTPHSVSQCKYLLIGKRFKAIVQPVS